MRNWSFSFDKNENEYNEAANALMEMFKDSEDYKKKKIVICGVKDKDETYKIFLSIEDTVPGSFIVSVSNAFEKHLTNAFTVVKSDCKDINVKLPIDCKINSWYEADPTIEKVTD